ncbi:MAG TPA: NADP-specific glutamate dehydrogenase [Opitutae bacterium]|nr:NADP-specific glutamate dehydrogenase [Opitutae bacterium]
MHPYIKKTLEVVAARNHSEAIFLQAVHEVLETLEPIVNEHPEIEKFNLLERMCEPERQTIFRVTWQGDDGKVHVNRGFRVAFNGALGPYKGGLRFHPTVIPGVIKFLAFEQVFKNSLTGLQIGGGKGGSDFDPHGRSDAEIMRFCQSFMSELYHIIGDRTDVPAGDIGVGAREIGFLFGQYKRLTKRHDLSVLTGKGVDWGGSLVRKEATGYGCVYFAEDMLATRQEGFKGKTCIVSGSGNVAIYAMEKLKQLGAKVVACSDSSGYIYDKNGIDLDLIKELKEIKRERVSAYVDKYPSAEFKPKANIWEVPCDAAFPCATQNEIDEASAKMLVKNGCQLVSEGANMPTTPEGIRVFQDGGLLYGPGKAANAGGVAVSALEMQQNVGWARWSFEEVDEKLRTIMRDIHTSCLSHAERYGKKGDYVMGANVAGFIRVAKAVTAYGLI